MTSQSLRSHVVTHRVFVVALTIVLGFGVLMQMLGAGDGALVGRADLRKG